MYFDINMTQIHRQGMTLQVNNICWLGTPTVGQDVNIRYPLNSDKRKLKFKSILEFENTY